MISVDVDNAVELRFDREHMEETELEEGEACCNEPNDDETNSSTIVDPDVALSYIDEKLLDVLGHFQKDFEGGVSAENLGAKFGGYGSFLPAYPRSPSKPDLPKSENLSDQKSLKVRIKVGKVNLSIQKKAEIYSGLGLDVSPSSSLNESPTSREGLHHDLLDIKDESLTRIIQIMTSDTIFGILLLSPLSDEVIRLTEIEWPSGESEPKIAGTIDQGSARKVSNGSDLKLTNKKMSQGDKLNIFEESNVSVSPTKGDKKHISHATSDVLKEETKKDTLACEELISSTSHNEDSSKLLPGAMHLSSESKKRSYGSQGIVAQEVKPLEDGLLSKSCLLYQIKKSSNASSISSKSDTEDLTKGLVKAVDRYKECPGDRERKDNKSIESEKMASVSMGKGSGLVEKKSNTILKDKATGKKNEELSTIECRVSAPNMTCLAGKVSNPHADPSAMAPLPNEDRVRCDKCHTWRLLPLGANPRSLAEKWVCSMLDWLPGMNHCSISQDDTTHALRAAQASTMSESKHKQHPLSSMNSPGVSFGGARRSTDDYSCPGFEETTALNKGHVSKDVKNQTKQESFSLFPNSKKRLQECTKVGSMNDIDKSPSINDFGSHNAARSSVSLGDKCGEESKDITADTMKSKLNKKKDTDIDGMKASKKRKTGDFHLKDENCISGLSEAPLTTNSRSIHGMSNGALGKDHHDSNNIRNSKGGMKKLSRSSGKPDVPNSISSDDGLQILAVHSPNDYLKRKISDTPVLERMSLLKECHEIGYRREKKARGSKSEDNVCNTDNPGTAEKVSRVTKDILGHDPVSTASQLSTDDADLLIKDLGSLQPSVAATSSSSKLSSSHRRKAGLQEMNDSPVESVSSSPLRTTDVSKFSNTSRDAVAKDAFQDAGFRKSPRISVDNKSTFDSCQTVKMRSDDGTDLLKNVKKKAETSHFTAQQVTKSNVSSPDKGKQNSCQTETLKQIQNVRDRSAKHEGQSKKAKGHSSRSKEKNQISRSVHDNGKVKHFEQEEDPSYEAKSKARISKSEGKFGISCDGIDKSHVSRTDSNPDHKDCREDIPLKVGVHDGKIARGNVISCQDMKQTETERSSKSLHSGKTVIEGSERRKSNLIQPSTRDQSEATKDLPPMVELKKESVECANNKDVLSRASKQSKKPAKLNGNQQTGTINSNSSTHKGQAAGENLVQKDSTSQAVTTALREAKDLKHLADRLKNSGSKESTGLYFQAALKFLHGASLLESCSSENTKQTEIQSLHIYSSTAKLCEFCAHEYEKSSDMAAAALAYKCVEVAYMHVCYRSRGGTIKYQDEVQTALQLVPIGDSPSSSASDIDNLNNAAIVDKAIASKGVCSPQVAGSHVLTAHYHTSCFRLIQLAQEVTFAMEASRKSRIRLGEAQNKEGISSVKRALDFNFQNMEGLLHLIRVAMEAINR